MNLFLAFLFASFGGLLLAQSRLSPKYAVVFGIPAPFLLLVVLQLEGISPLYAGLCGLVFALFSIGRSLIALQLPVIVSALLAASQSILWTLFALCSCYFLKLDFLLSVVAIACAGTALNWLEWSILPLWGTAQNFACTFPINRPFIAIAGAAGGTWSALLIAAWFAQIFRSPDAFLFGISGVLIAALIFALDKFWRPKSPKSLKVAVYGWAGTEFDALTSLSSKLVEAVRLASEAGAKLIVTPEAAIQIEDRETFRFLIQGLATKYEIALAIGYFDAKQRKNCIDLIDTNGIVNSRYVKTHLVPVFETYNAGEGDIALMIVDGVKVGGLICQDDNFPDIARKYARAGTQLLVVPTNDWVNVKDLHFASHRWRCLEFRYALARAASDGISSLIGSNGEVLKKADHFATGAQLLIADVPVGSGKPTIYAWSGDLFPLVCGLVTLGCLIFAR